MGKVSKTYQRSLLVNSDLPPPSGDSYLLIRISKQAKKIKLTFAQQEDSPVCVE